MIEAEYYSFVYMLIIMAFAIPVCSQYSRYSSDRLSLNMKEPLRKSLLFTIIMIIYIAIRPNSPLFSDGPGYWYGILDHRWEHYTLEEVSNQFATKYLMSMLSSNEVDPRIGFYLFSIINYGFAFLAMRKMFPKDTLLAMIMYCGAFCTFGGAVNGIKNGMAASLFLCAIAYKDNWKYYVPFLILSFGLHHSMQLSIAAFLACKFYTKTRNYSYAWIFGLVMASAHITYFQIIFAGYTDESGQGYLITDADSWVTGFRLDFVLYSAAPLIVAWWISHERKIQIDKSYTFSINVYLLMNTIWMLCMYSSYTNRIAALSWSIFPILLLYPFLNMRIVRNQYKYVTYTVWGQLVFTTFMTLIAL